MTGGILAARQLGPAVRELVPAWFVQVFVVFTELGNVGLFLVVFALDYWFLDRERGAHAIGLVVGGMALITALKFHFAAPRPPASVTAIPISGFSFPSGHAMGAAVAYGTLAVDLDVGSWKQRFPVAGALIAFVALSRVVLGVHFVRDVVAGVLFGLGFVVVAFALTKRDPRKAFFLAVALGAVAFVVSGASSDGIEVLGSAIGGTLAWEALEDVPRVDVRGARVVLVAAVLPVLAAVGYVSVYWDHPPAVGLLLNAGILASILAAPLIEDPLERMRGTGPAET
ncbi:phosphoesterase PA-phosphatase [Halobacteriales archaeon QS_5_68_33]|nr:MAG: phosphoesterase PA-phosphatase [Halobacteriales archaeon QS_5_68_33]